MLAQDSQYNPSSSLPYTLDSPRSRVKLRRALQVQIQVACTHTIAHKLSLAFCVVGNVRSLMLRPEAYAHQYNTVPVVTVGQWQRNS